MAKKTTVALLFGGRSAEHEVSIRSAASIYNHLDKDRYKTVSLFLDKSGRWKQVASPLLPPGELRQGRAYPFLPWGMGGFTAAVKADIYFPVLHGPYGEDGTIQGLLELADVPFVGAGVLASAAGMDKAVMKILFQASGLRVAPCRVVLDSEWASRREEVLRRLNREMVPPLFVKPANLGSSVGISKVGSMDRLEEALELAFRYDRKVLVEKGLEAREIECAVLGNDAPAASLPGEVMPAGEFYDYKDKYLDGKTQFGIPANLPPATVEEVRRQAVAAFQACGCDGLTRVDFLLEKSTGLLYVNEVNTLPGFTEISMYPKLWEVSGMSFDRLVDRLIELGFERHARKKRCTESGAG